MYPGLSFFDVMPTVRDLNEQYSRKQDHVADWVADVTRGLKSLYVYCPLVEPRMVGDVQVPMLRIVPVEGRDAEMVLSENVFQRTRDIIFQLGVGNNRDMLSPGNDGVASF
jgi:hypothetical protein